MERTMKRKGWAGIGRKTIAAGLAALMAGSLCACGGENPAGEIAAQQTETEETADINAPADDAAETAAGEETADAADAEEEEGDGLANQTAEEDVPQLDGYRLLWHDEFNGTEMNEENWSYEPHAPGWTNAELQEYTESEDNVYVRNGKMTIRAIKTQTDKGKDYYTSGKVNSKNKRDFLYGKVTARAKAPVGQGLWPAIWMMPTDQSHYGGWPRCGEIDIMEVLGNDVSVAYGTIHYGKPHQQQQGIYTLEEDTFADDFHEYSVEWEPAEIRYYIDGDLYLTVTDWFSGDVGIDDRPFPAPFDQTFYVQMNLAVGGNWPGNPDETTDFDNAKFEIDYVRVYQKESYDTNVTKPEKVFREATEDGNYIYNGDFAEAENLDDEENWQLLLAEGGAAEASVSDGMIEIGTQSSGTQTYSVQLVQTQLPMVKGNTYRLTFEACADAPRTMNVCVSAPTAGWIRYLEDTPVELTADWQTYTYEFTMKDRDDNNGRLEFNLGNQGSTTAVRIRNVRVEQTEP